MEHAWWMRSSSPPPFPLTRVHTPDDPHEAYESCAVTDELIVPGVTVREERGYGAPRASLSGGLDLQPLLDHIANLAGENVTPKRNVADKDKRIEELEEKLRFSEEKLTAMSDRVDVRPTPSMSTGPPASQTE